MKILVYLHCFKYVSCIAHLLSYDNYPCDIDWFDFFASVDMDDTLLQDTSVS